MKAFLFVQNDGDARLKCEGQVAPFHPGGARVLIGPEPGYSPTSSQASAMNLAARWWLVECESCWHGEHLVEHARTGNRDWKIDAEILFGLGGGILAIGARHGA